MKLLTIQSRKVLNTLRKGDTYKADFYYMNHLKPHLVEARQLLMRYLNYESVPIFCAIYDRYITFKNTYVTRSSVILELDVPDEFVTIQSLYDWIDLHVVLCYANVDMPEQVKLYRIAETLDPGYGSTYVAQAVLPYIKPEWLVNAYKCNKEFIEYFNSTAVLNEDVINNKLTKLGDFI